MKGIILSAGQGRRLLPMTADTPKCALRIHGQSILEWQLHQLAECGIDRVTVVLGFGANQVESLLAARNQSNQVRTVYNPFFPVTDNLVSCWVAGADMNEDFILLNGDTLFETEVLKRLLGAPSRQVILVTDHKSAYDADDMKVTLDGERLVRVGKDLPSDQTDGESIGMLLFRGEGPALFFAAVERALRNPQALKQWYLSVIDKMAQLGLVWTLSIQGLQWVEVDCPADLDQADKLVAKWRASTEGVVGVGSI